MDKADEEGVENNKQENSVGVDDGKSTGFDHCWWMLDQQSWGKSVHIWENLVIRLKYHVGC